MTTPYASTASSSIVARMRRAAMLDGSLYREVEHDTSATGQAAVVVALTAVAAAVGQVWRGGPGLFTALIGTLVGWAVWSGIAYLVGTRLFQGQATWGEVARTLGFAQTPALLLAAAIVPGLGTLSAIVVAVWTAVTGWVALREALDLDAGKTLLTVLLGWVALQVAQSILPRLLGVPVY